MAEIRGIMTKTLPNVYKSSLQVSYVGKVNLPAHANLLDLKKVI